MKFTFSDNKYLSSASRQLEFFNLLRQKAEADGCELQYSWFLNKSWLEDRVVYNIPEGADLSSLADLYYRMHHDELIDPMHEEIENQLYETTMRGHD